MSELKCRTIRESVRQRWMIMMMPCRLVLGLLVLNVVLASPPRYTRQVEPDNYDEDFDKVDVEYFEEMTTDEPEIEISTLSPDEDNDPTPGASLEEEEPEEDPEKESGELPIMPSLIPSGSGVPGVLMGPDTSGEEELRLTPTEILHISGDSLGSGDMLSSGGSGASGASGVFGKIPDAREYHSGETLGSGGSGGLSSGVSADEQIYITVTTGPEEVSGETGAPEKPLLPVEPVTLGPPEESGVPEEWVTIIPTLKEEEALFPTTQTPGSTTGSGLPESPEPDVDVIETDIPGMPTCMLCICLRGSVYCDDVNLVNVPPLPKDTTHFYARYNRITKINKSDFANMNKLKRIDLTSNAISKIEDGALFGLPALEELVIRENSVAQLPALPATMTLVDASHNHLGRTGIQNEAFKDMTGLLYLYLTDNSIDHIPVPLPESLRSLHLQNNNIQMIHEDTFCKQNDLNYIRMALEDIRLDGNPVNLSRTPQAYVCLPRIPVGALI
ncbi:hypothetical protein PDJAM_G00088570 [Pangasius djambal]|uniref:Uncharacterized protein n=1 Tax=Pangasius djambal TaxID=1691987 RepID=A0ACC5Z4E3_9TELE|nr:hypothetical protein [Pangasius djambal]